MLPLRDFNETQRAPVVTLLLIAINVAVFVFVQPAAFRDFDETNEVSRAETAFLYEHALVPCELTHWRPLSSSLEARCSSERAGPAQFFPNKNIALSVLASMFLHANWLHLIGNMWYLWVFGDNVEDRYGPLGYLGLYLLSGIAAALGQTAFSPDSVTPTLGASGAIAGVLGAYLVLFPRAKVVNVFLPIFFLPFVLRAEIVLVVWFIVQFFTDPNSGVAWVAHVTGFVVGVVVTLVVKSHLASTRRQATWEPG